MHVKVQQTALLERLLGLFTILLCLATWPLWAVPASLENPQIPWFKMLCGVPQSVDRTLLAGLGLTSILLLALSGRSTARTLVPGAYLFCLVGLTLLDQHRLQPWVLQFILFGFVFTTDRETVAIRCCRWVVLSIYFYSALSKIDASFLAAHGQLLLTGLCQAMQLDQAMWSPQFKMFLSGMFPAGEILVTLLLLSRRSVRFGVVAAAAMHITIILAVGPLGLQHEFGVLLWNVYFLAQNIFLFWLTQPALDVTPQHLTSERFCYAATLLAISLPILETWGLYDHWPAWAVYSSRPEKLTALVEQATVETFPDWLKAICGAPAPLETKVPILLDRWSFQERHCPVYPQLRYRLALSKALIQSHAPNDEVQFLIEMTPDRWSGEGKQLTLNGWEQLDSQLGMYWLNTNPRKFD